MLRKATVRRLRAVRLVLQLLVQLAEILDDAFLEFHVSDAVHAGGGVLAQVIERFTQRTCGACSTGSS